MKVGGREVVHTVGLIVPKGEDAYVDFHVGQWKINLRVIFKEKLKDGENGSLSIEIVDGNPQLSLIGWDNSLGTATIRPVELGTASDGKKLRFMLSHWLVGDTNKLDIQFLLGGQP